MSFFDRFPQVLYTLDDPAKNNFKQVVDIFVRTAMLQSILNNLTIFYPYYVKDGDTPDNIASKYYNDPTTHWIILYTNLILDPYYKWPLNYSQFQAQLISNYGSIEASQTTLDHIEKHTNVIVTSNYQQTINTYISILANDIISIDGSSTFPTISNPVIKVGANNVVNIEGSLIDTSVELIAISGYEQLFNRNEQNRNIQLIDAGYIPQIVAQFNNLMSQ